MAGRVARCLVALLLASASGRLLAQQVPGTIVLVTGEEPTLPFPAISNRTANADLADQLYLRLGLLGSTFRTAGDNALTPMLAQRWQRVDARTLLFDLDPRARWQDGVPVSARDVVFTYQLMMDPSVGTGRIAFESIASVEAVTDRQVRVRFKRAFSEQLYLFAYNMQPLPAHLLSGTAPTALAQSEYARFPVGNGPYRYVRRIPGQSIELRADPTFFLGAPTIARVVIRVAQDASARINMLLAGETDVMGDLTPPDATRIAEQPRLTIVNVPHVLLMYAAFNFRAPTDSASPHPVLSDHRVREALRFALDRQTMARGVFGPSTGTPDAAQSQLWSWITGGVMQGIGRDLPRAKALLAAAGWKDTNGDGILDRNGAPLRLVMLYPSTSGARHAFALQSQAMWREAGVDVQLERLEPGTYTERLNARRFDLVILAVNQSVSPASLTESWSCASARTAGSTNNGRWCDPTFDRLLANAETSGNPVPAYRAVLERMADEVPAIFLAAPFNQVAVDRRFAGVTIRPANSWLSIWRWRVQPSAALARDR